MPYSKIFLHAVWSTKCRTPFLDTPQLRKKVWKHIFDNSREKGIKIDTINGYDDHCHCLFILDLNITVSKTLQLIKGEASNWINQEKLCPSRFEWQRQYFVVSVSPSHVDRVRRYIRNQEQHHRQRTFNEEYEEMIRKYGFEIQMDD